MVEFTTHICGGENTFKINFSTDNYEIYKYIQSCIRDQMDKETKTCEN